MCDLFVQNCAHILVMEFVDCLMWGGTEPLATGLGKRSFAVAGPKAWNSLPSELRCIAVDSTFRRRLKAELFSRAYGVSDST